MLPEPIITEDDIEIVSYAQKRALKARKPFNRSPSTKTKSKKILRAIRGKKKPKKFKADLWKEYGLNKPQYVRYSGLGGILWFVMSQYVRQEEFKKYGVCVDGCGTKIADWRLTDCGHFRSARSQNTRFLRENLGMQTKPCNSPFRGNGNPYGFGKTINERYGEGTAEHIVALSLKKSKPLSKKWYDEQIRHWQKALENLKS